MTKMVIWKVITKQKYQEYIVNYFKRTNLDVEVVNEVILVKRSTKDRDFLIDLRIDLENRGYPCKFHRAFV